MAHRYGDTVLVQVDAASGLPRAFTWRGLTYAPLSVIASWHLRDKWWEGAAARTHSDRQYYRVMLPDSQVFELYCDAGASGYWMSCWIDASAACLPSAPDSLPLSAFPMSGRQKAVIKYLEEVRWTF